MPTGIDYRLTTFLNSLSRESSEKEREEEAKVLQDQKVKAKMASLIAGFLSSLESIFNNDTDIAYMLLEITSLASRSLGKNFKVDRHNIFYEEAIKERVIDTLISMSPTSSAVLVKTINKFTKDEVVIEEAIKSTCTIDRDRQVVKIKKEVQEGRNVDRAFMSW